MHKPCWPGAAKNEFYLHPKISFPMRMFPGIDTCTNYGDWADWRIGRTFSGVFCCCPTSPRLRLPLLSNFCKFLQFARWLNSFTHPSFVTPSLFACFPKSKSAPPFFPQNWFLKIFWFLTLTGFRVGVCHKCCNSAFFSAEQISNNSKRERQQVFLNCQLTCWLVRATNLFLNCKPVFLAPGSDLWVGWCGQQI